MVEVDVTYYVRPSQKNTRLEQDDSARPTIPVAFHCCQSPCRPLSADRSKSGHIGKMPVCERALTFQLAQLHDVDPGFLQKVV
jgi:hypothetical protein